MDFDGFLEELSAMCKLLKTKWTRTRFTRTCMDTPLGRLFQDELNGFDATVQPGRWGTVLRASGAALNVQDILETFWSIHRSVVPVVQHAKKDYWGKQ